MKKHEAGISCTNSVLSDAYYYYTRKRTRRRNRDSRRFRFVDENGVPPLDCMGNAVITVTAGDFNVTGAVGDGETTTYADTDAIYS